MKLSKEIWKDVVGWEGLYEVSNKLRIRRGAIYSKIRATGTIITQRINYHGYLMVDLWKNNKCKRRSVHTLYMRAFIGECPNGMETRHLDDNKLNNTPKNLCYGTRSENLRDSYKNSDRKSSFSNPKIFKKAFNNRYQPKGERHGMSKLIESQVREIRNYKKYYGYLIILSKKYNVHIKTICGIRSKKEWRHI